MMHPEKPTVPEVLPLVQDYYRQAGNAAGGNLHVVLDDSNIDLCCIRSALEYCRRCGDAQGMLIARLLLQMSRSQRYRIIKSFATLEE